MLHVLVTGASRGLGLEFVRQYLHRGDYVYATCRNPATATKLQELAAAHPNRCVILPLDTRNEASHEALVAELTARDCRLEVLINNAGVNAKSVQGNSDFESYFAFGQLKAESLLDMIHTNAIAHILLTQSLLPFLRHVPNAKVMNISSWLGSLSQKREGGNYAYSASKTALNMLTRTMAFDLRPMGIIAVAANPGWVRTDMGGVRATLTAEDSVAGLISVVDKLTPGDAGRFIQWDGTDHKW